MEMWSVVVLPLVLIRIGRSSKSLQMFHQHASFLTGHGNDLLSVPLLEPPQNLKTVGCGGDLDLD